MDMGIRLILKTRFKQSIKHATFCKRTTFSKVVAGTCRIFTSWKNRYGNKNPRVTEAIDGMLFETINNDERAIVKKR